MQLMELNAGEFSRRFARSLRWWEQDDALRNEVARQRQSLMDFYAAGLAPYNGDRDAWAAAMERVRTSDGDNPNYHWISGERQ